MDLAIGEAQVAGEFVFTGVVRDISDRKAAERRLEEALNLSERSLNEVNAVIESIDYAICFMDENLRARVTNNAFVDMWRIDPAFIESGPTMAELMNVNRDNGLYKIAEDKFDAWVERRVDAVREGNVPAVEIDLKDGRTLIYRCIALPDGGRMLTYFDITKQKAVQQEMAEAMSFINESIEYGSRIQRALLPEDTLFSEIFADHLLVWNPRDVVGGDLIWLRPADDGFLVLVGDCTGHGVPGAFMTMIANGAIDQALKEVPSGQPDLLLNHIHNVVKMSLGQDSAQGDSDDGLEMGVVLISPDMKQMQFAGARFSLLSVDESGNDREIKGDRGGIGYRRYGLNQKFSAHTIEIERGQCFYMWSDGLVDQVGGEKRRGFGKRRLIRTIVDYHRMPMAHQRAQILREFEDYTHREAIRDDVTLFGFKPRRNKNEVI